MCVCVQISPVDKDASHIGLGATLLQHDLILTNYSCNDPISKQGHVLGQWGSGLQHLHFEWGDKIQPHDVEQTLLPVSGLSQALCAPHPTLPKIPGLNGQSLPFGLRRDRAEIWLRRRC